MTRVDQEKLGERLHLLWLRDNPISSNVVKEFNANVLKILKDTPIDQLTGIKGHVNYLGVAQDIPKGCK